MFKKKVTTRVKICLKRITTITTDNKNNTNEHILRVRDGTIMIRVKFIQVNLSLS